MRIRARYMHHLEVLSDNCVGVFINYWLGMAVLIQLGLPISHGQNLIFSSVMFVAAYIRKYYMRRVFSNWINSIYKRQSEEVQEQAGAD